MATEDGWTRVSAVLDRLVGERERRNRERQGAIARGEAPGPEHFIPTVRDVREALLLSDGKGLSYRDLGPLVTRYVQENAVRQRLRPRPGQHFERTGERVEVDPLPNRVRRGVDRAIGVIDKQREVLARIFADEVQAETEALLKQNSALKAELSELHRQLADKSAIEDDADEVLRRLDELSKTIEDEQARRVAAEVEADGARKGAKSAEVERDKALAACAAAEARRDEAAATLDRLSAELERAGREQEENWRAIAELTARLASTDKSMDKKVIAKHAAPT